MRLSTCACYMRNVYLRPTQNTASEKFLFKYEQRRRVIRRYRHIRVYIDLWIIQRVLSIILIEAAAEVKSENEWENGRGLYIEAKLMRFNSFTGH